MNSTAAGKSTVLTVFRNESLLKYFWPPVYFAMGLPMDDLHTPTVPSGPTTRVQGNDVGLSNLTLMELIDKRNRLEEELKALGSVLDSVSGFRYYICLS